MSPFASRNLGMPKLNLYSALLLCFLLAGCASSGTFTPISSTTEPIDSNSAAYVVVTAPQDRLLEAELAGKIKILLEASRVFQSVTHSNQDSKYELFVQILDINKVSMVAKLMLGVFAGSDSVSGMVTLKEVSTNNVIRRFSVEAKGAAHIMSEEHGMSEALSELANQIQTGLQ